MKTAVILGTNHGIQRGENRKDDFKSYLKNLCEQHKIRVIAEEINDNANFIVAKSVCENLCIDHLIIDPNPTEYEQFGIKKYHVIEYEVMKLYDLDLKPSDDNGTPLEALNEFESRIRNEHCHPRESVWLKRIQKHGNWPTLVICGSHHFETFSNLLLDNDIRVISTESHW